MKSGCIPAKESEKALETVAAGLAKDVDEVNQYAAPIKEATDMATFSFLDRKIIITKIIVAKTSLT